MRSSPHPWAIAALAAIAAVIVYLNIERRHHSRPPSQPSSCAVQLADHDATVYFSARSFNVQPSCRNLIKVAAGSGELWNESGTFVTTNAGGIPTPTDTADTIICSLHKGSENVEVWDAGGAIYGEQTCEAYLASNWVQNY